MAQQQQTDSVDLAAPRFNLDSYLGRLQHFQSTTSPLTLLASKQALLQAQGNVQKVDQQVKEAGGRGVWVTRAARETYWKDRQLVESSIHPDTGLPVPLAFRMSAFVPTNLIICAGMLTPNPSMRTLIFWQWMNQSLNAAVNSANASGKEAMSTKDLLTSYSAATFSSVLIAVSLSKLVPRIPERYVSAAGKDFLGKFVPFASVASAGIVNITCMRWKEIRDGIDVFRFKPSSTAQADIPGPLEKEELGKSSIAGGKAVAQSAASRVFTNIPTLVLPPLLMTFLAARGVFRGPRAGLKESLTQLSAIGTCLFVFLPPSIAVFPQQASVKLGKLEPELQALGDADETVFFNKGL